jgi:hypothetical protein
MLTATALLSWLAGPLGGLLAAIVGGLALFAGIKTKGALDRRQGRRDGLADARKEQEQIDDAAAERAVLARMGVGDPDDAALDGLLAAQSATRRERLVPRHPGRRDHPGGAGHDAA